MKPVLFAAGLALIASGASAQLPADLTGEWTGGYLSSDGSDVNTFDVQLTQEGARVSGTITEVNAIGDLTQSMFLTSTFVGQRRGMDISFTKTYDGSGGVAHSVIYQGKIDATGRRVRGTYNAEGATGKFEMVR